MVLDVVIHHWVTVEATTEAGAEGPGVSVQDLVAYVYAYKRLIALTQPERLQRLFGVLTDLFGRFGLHNNARMTVIMACQTCHTSVSMLVVAYKIQ